MEKLLELIGLCKCSVTIWCNEYKDMYSDIHQGIADVDDELSDEIEAGMVETGNIYHIICFPLTPIGSFDIWHYDLEKAVDEAIKEIKG